MIISQYIYQINNNSRIDFESEGNFSKTLKGNYSFQKEKLNSTTNLNDTSPLSQLTNSRLFERKNLKEKCLKELNSSELKNIKQNELFSGKFVIDKSKNFAHKSLQSQKFNKLNLLSNEKQMRNNCDKFKFSSNYKSSDYFKINSVNQCPNMLEKKESVLLYVQNMFEMNDEIITLKQKGEGLISIAKYILKKISNKSYEDIFSVINYIRMIISCFIRNNEGRQIIQEKEEKFQKLNEEVNNFKIMNGNLIASNKEFENIILTKTQNEIQLRSLITTLNKKIKDKSTQMEILNEQMMKMKEFSQKALEENQYISSILRNIEKKYRCLKEKNIILQNLLKSPVDNNKKEVQTNIINSTRSDELFENKNKKFIEVSTKKIKIPRLDLSFIDPNFCEVNYLDNELKNHSVDSESSNAQSCLNEFA